MNHTLRVPRSRVDPGYLDHEIDTISSTGKAGPREIHPSEDPKARDAEPPPDDRARRERPFADFHSPSRMLRHGTSKPPFAAGAKWQYVLKILEVATKYSN